jgi:hypothetical protein
MVRNNGEFIVLYRIESHEYNALDDFIRDSAARTIQYAVREHKQRVLQRHRMRSVCDEIRCMPPLLSIPAFRGGVEYLAAHMSFKLKRQV